MLLPQCGVQTGKVTDVVAMEAFRAGLKQRRGVAIRNAKFVQVIDDFQRLLKTKVSIEL